ncbi:MAG: hypothetical protein AAF611_12320 [Bacteroidota bacterium]
MLKHIKNIEGATQLSKKEQQNFTGGQLFQVLGVYCPGGEILVFTETCPQSHPFMHPQGHCLCCAVPWAPILEG